MKYWIKRQVKSELLLKQPNSQTLHFLVHRAQKHYHAKAQKRQSATALRRQSAEDLKSLRAKTLNHQNAKSL